MLSSRHRRKATTTTTSHYRPVHNQHSYHVGSKVNREVTNYVSLQLAPRFLLLIAPAQAINGSMQHSYEKSDSRPSPILSSYQLCKREQAGFRPISKSSKRVTTQSLMHTLRLQVSASSMPRNSTAQCVGMRVEAPCLTVECDPTLVGLSVFDKCVMPHDLCIERRTSTAPVGL
jgi:hypothetical protein